MRNIFKNNNRLATWKMRHKSSGGFTILETLVAIAILVLAITGPISLVASSIRSSGYARDSITAYYLAQEAVEFIRNTRDINSLNEGLTPTDWLDGVASGDNTVGHFDCLNDYGAKTNICSLNHNGSYLLTQCDPSGCAPLTFLGTIGTVPYGSSSGQESAFTRDIWLERVPEGAGVPSAERQVIINVHVKWKTGAVENEFLLREYLTNWKSEL